MNDETVNGRSDGRLPDGRFGAGNRAGLGNTNNRRMQALRSSLLEAATPEQTAAIIKKLGEQAAAGDVPSAKVYLEHTCGKPLQALSLSGPDGSPLTGDVLTLQTVILAALAPYPAARHQVASALMQLRHADDGPAAPDSDGA